jgi:predicted acylesterase/phospholipase RssA
MQRLQRAHRPKTITVILTGAVTRGAFEAGALKILAEREIRVHRIVAVSSGALNGTAYAAGVRDCREKTVAEELITLWHNQGGFRDVIDVNLAHLLTGKGLSDQDKLLSLLRRHIRPSQRVDRAPIELHIVVAPLRGTKGSIGGRPATTYTKLLSFHGEHFDREDLLEQVFTAATASSAFPCLFTPVNVPGVGPCIDGGLVNSAPMRYACVDDGLGVGDAIVEIAATPTYVEHPRRSYRGRGLVAHVIDMLFTELIYNDLRAAGSANQGLLGLEDLARKKSWSPDEVAEIKDAIGWQQRRTIPVIPIMPLAPLPGDVFTGFFSSSARKRYVSVGIERANQVLDQLGWR